ncbi:hypothetical protein BD410DRAFT_474795 [Rickenella mellea]|uniref:Uncharacterized protein n=1 Tax=Rickenella mellea TaxID=50990 RepID=A0A4Y7QGW5_9AGAM|nr:hypothetical protein BD410DRAFT_474795 [Rickenella mellea]
MLAATMLPIGLLIFGWTSERRDFWLIPDFGVFVFSVEIWGNWTCMQTYLVCTGSVSSAKLELPSPRSTTTLSMLQSTISGVSSFRLSAPAGFGFPLFASDLYGKMGDEWGTTVLALLCLAIGSPAPFISTGTVLHCERGVNPLWLNSTPFRFPVHQVHQIHRKMKRLDCDGPNPQFPRAGVRSATIFSTNICFAQPPPQ